MKLDNVVRAIEAKRNPPLDRFREILDSIEVLAEKLHSQVKAIPKTDLTPVLSHVTRSVGAIPRADLTPVLKHVTQAVNGIQFPEFPDIPVPERTDLGPVLQQIGALQSAVGLLAAKIDGIPTDLPEITVASQTAPQIVAEQRLKKINFKIIRNQMGGIREVEAVESWL